MPHGMTGTRPGFNPALKALGPPLEKRLYVPHCNSWMRLRRQKKRVLLFTKYWVILRAVEEEKKKRN